jgi:hypothetical protein
LLATWPGRIVAAGITALVLLLGSVIVFRPEPPRPLPEPIAAPVTPSQVVAPAPNPERVDIEMSNNAAKPLQVETFEATPNPVPRGKQVTLSWSVPAAVEVTISPSIGSVPAQGTREVSARADTQYTLTAKSLDGQSVSRTLNVVVERAVTAAPRQAPAVTNPTPPAPVTTPAQPAPAPVENAPPPAPEPTPQPVAPQPGAPQQLRASPVMNLFHDHGVRAGQPGWPRCWGQMQIGGGRVVFKTLGTSDGRRDDFVVPASAVDDVRVNRVGIRGHPSFHMRISGQNFNFVPAAGAPVMYVNVIEKWLQAK